jgi:uncharacterized membrane protein YfcA
MLPETMTVAGFFWVAFSIFLLAMSKGGFPVGPIALPFLVLLWPGKAESAKQAVAFMLPVMCMMDLVAIWLYRREILWHHVLPLVPGALLGVLLAGMLFAQAGESVFAITDSFLKLLIGCTGLVFIFYRIFRRRILRRLLNSRPGIKTSLAFGLGAGVTSTIAHAGGPVAQMYYLPQGLKKLNLAATMAGFFFVLNAVKLVPFTFHGRITGETLRLGLLVLPVVPLGVLSGWFLVHRIRESWYIPFLYVVLAVTSTTLIVKAL